MFGANSVTINVKVIWTQLKLALLFGIILSIVFILVAPALLGIKYLDETATALVLEKYVAIIGVILITPLFFPEHDKSIAEVVESKYISPHAIILSRLILSLVVLFALIAIIAMVMRFEKCEFPILKYIWGTFISALALGSIGFFGAGISNNIIVGYFLAICYYLLNTSLGKKLGEFYLFSMSKGSFEEKYYLLAAALLLIAITFIVNQIRYKKR